MEQAEAIERFTPKLLKKLYGFSYARCQNHHEAEDLCSEIILQLLKTIRRGREIQNFEAFCWKVARNVHADFCEKRRKNRNLIVTQEELESLPVIWVNPIEEYLLKNSEEEKLQEIIRQIASLSKIYREVMIQYYLEEKPVSVIAGNLGISETTVKQRLFSARNTMKNEVEQMQEKELTVLLKPIYINFIGTGNPVGNSPSTKAERQLSKSVLYLCRKKGCKAAEIARELNVPLLYIEDELDILSKGENGSYGLVREISKDKYIANIMLLEQEETEEMLREIQPEINLFIRNVHTYFQSHKEELETLPLLGKRQSLSYTAWTFFQGVIYDIARQGISQYLAEKFFPDAESVQREYSQMGIVCRRRQEAERPKWFYGMDRAFANQICGYKSVHFHNLYGERLEARFHTGENISQNEELQLTIRAVKGIPVNTLEEAERETAAKAIADGYLLQEDGVLYPKIVAVTKETWEMIQKTGRKICEDNRRVMEKMAEKIAKGIKRYVPKHLISEYQMAAVMVWSAMTGMMIEAGIQSGTLSTPTDGSEGTFLWIEE